MRGNLSLIDVYDYDDQPTAELLLWRFMKMRLDEPLSNISHTLMPSRHMHSKFIASQPYAAWYFIHIGAHESVVVMEDFKGSKVTTKPPAYIGTVYLSKQDEIGIYLHEDYRGMGIGGEVVKDLMRRHPRTDYRANVNPANSPSLAFFEKLGFKTKQVTLVREVR